MSPGRYLKRNEMLDVAVYSEALAGKLGWRVKTPLQWDMLAAEREAAGAHPDSAVAATRRAVQLGLFMPRQSPTSPPRPDDDPPAALSNDHALPPRLSGLPLPPARRKWA